MLQELINNFYLTEKEAKVYLAALKLGRSRVSDIARKAELNRITAYEILKRLVQMGIAHSAAYGGIQTFTVISPEMLIQKMESRLKMAQKALPQLALLNRANSGKPAITSFEGIEGIRSIYEDTLSCKEKIIYNVANPDNLINAIGEDFFVQYVKKRVRRKIVVKVLIPETNQNKKYAKEKREAKREVKFFNQKLYDIPNEILIYDNKIAMLSFSSLIGVIIEEKDIANSVKTIWQMIWQAN